MDYGRISSLQLGLMLYPTIVSTAILTGPSVMVAHAKNDLWLSPIWAALGGFVVFYVTYLLAKRYPQHTFIQYIQKIIGSIPGKILGCLYLLFILQISGNIVREYTDFISTFLIHTPSIVICATLVVVCAMAIMAGLETVGRASQFLFPLLTIPLLLTLILVLKDVEPQKILPILDHGILPTILGAFTPLSWFSEIFLVSFLAPYLNNLQKGFMAGTVTIICSMFTMIAVSLIMFMLLGDFLSVTLYPFVDMANYISVADFFESLESAVMAIWVIGVFVKLSVFYYALSIGTTHLLELSSMRPVVLPLGLLIVLFSFWGIPDTATEVHLGKAAIPGGLFLFNLLIPCLLLLISSLRTRQGISKGVNSG